MYLFNSFFFFFQAEDGIRDGHVTGVQTCALPICLDREQFSDGANGNSSVQSRMTFVIWFGRFRLLSAILLASIPACAEQNQSSPYSSCLCRLQLLQSPPTAPSNPRRLPSPLPQSPRLNSSPTTASRKPISSRMNHIFM